MKRNNYKILCVLMLVMSILYMFDQCGIGRYFGYEKVKNYLNKEMSVFPLGERFFGLDIYNFYTTDKIVNSNIVKEEKIGNLYKVTLESNTLYSNFIATVVSIKKHNNMYKVTFSLPAKELSIYNIKKLNVSLYQKINVDTIIGEVDGYYFYEEN